jgi:hypothetical protein
MRITPTSPIVEKGTIKRQTCLGFLLCFVYEIKLETSNGTCGHSALALLRTCNVAPDVTAVLNHHHRTNGPKSSVHRRDYRFIGHIYREGCPRLKFLYLRLQDLA